MYKDLGTVIITGRTGTGKSNLIEKYINQIIDDKDTIIYIIDLKRVDLFEYAKKQNVEYITSIEDIEEKLINPIQKNEEYDKNKYIFIDEYFSIYFSRNYHNQIKKILKKRKNLNLNIIMASQEKTVFSQGMRKNVDAIIHLN